MREQGSDEGGGGVRGHGGNEGKGRFFLAVTIRTRQNKKKLFVCNRNFCSHESMTKN